MANEGGNPSSKVVPSLDGGTGNGAVDAADDGSMVACPDSSQVEPLTGPCEGTGTCQIHIVSVCRPGVYDIPLSPDFYNCECEIGQWSCQFFAGGTGVMECPDAGTD
jgi:hypothetical protein